MPQIVQCYANVSDIIIIIVDFIISPNSHDVSVLWVRLPEIMPVPLTV